MKVVAELADKFDAWILSDEVYSKIIYEGKHVSIYDFPEVKDRTILLEGHSKTYAMTGWRLGFAAMPKPIAEKLTKLNEKAAAAEIKCRYRVNGDGAATDYDTGLQWEQKTDDGTVHDKDNTYTWSTLTDAPDGPAFYSGSSPKRVCRS